jgi:hypothetical protein
VKESDWDEVTLHMEIIYSDDKDLVEEFVACGI